MVRSGTAIAIFGLLLFSHQRLPAACQPCDEARTLIEAGKYGEAASLLKKAVKTDKKAADPRGLLAIAYARLDERKKAVDALDEFFKLDPSPKMVREVSQTIVTRLGLPHSRDFRFDVPDGTTPPVVLFTSLATYPTMAGQVGAERDVRVQGVIGTNGRAGRLELVPVGDWAFLQTAGFADAAMEALQRWRFFPAMREDAPVPVEFRATVHFRIIK